MQKMIVIAEDSQAMVEMAGIIERLFGATPHQHNVVDAAAVQAGEYDAIVLCCDGVAAKRDLPRLFGLNPHARILAVVPFACPLSERYLIGLGADDALRRPFTRARLAITLQNLLRLSALERNVKKVSLQALA
jgi:hypothetical protein